MGFTFRWERFTSDHDSTLALMFVEQRWECFGLEDEYRDVKVPRDTRIPAGTYRLSLHRSSRFQPEYRRRFGPTHAGMIHLLDVPGFSWILIHCGNHDGDTDGCLLVGDVVTGNTRTSEGWIGNSRDAYRRVCLPLVERLAAGEPGAIIILDRDLNTREPLLRRA